MIAPLHGRPRSGLFQGLAMALLLLALTPSSAAAHAELETSSPADGATVPSPFGGPIMLAFSAALAEGSRAELVGPSGAIAIESAVGPETTLTITLPGPLEPGGYEVRWTSVAEDTDVARGTFTFTVEAAAEPTATATPEALTATPASPSASPGPPASPSPSPTEPGAPATSTDVLVPIVVVVLAAAAGAAYFMTRRNRPTTAR